jgi:Fe-S protein assembly co-chaperone HscB
MEDPFSTLGLARRFDLSSADVQRAWLARAAEAHPDRAGEADDGEALRETAMLNEARRTLQDAERRADALLTLLGGPTREQEKGLNPEFLMGIMDVRQELESAQQARDESELARLREWADDERRAYSERIGAMFKGLGASPAADSLRAIRLALNEWRYIERMIEQSVID